MKNLGMTKAGDIIRLLGMKPHPEGGHYVETFRDSKMPVGRAASTAIYFLLRRGERSHWHKVDAAEAWHFYAGDALRLRLSRYGQGTDIRVLGPNLLTGERPQIVVPAGVWQSAESLGDWTLVGCTVAPGFRFEGLEMAPKGWEPA
jgi:predicted cupin superfamily sugar epimerase